MLALKNSDDSVNLDSLGDFFVPEKKEHSSIVSSNDQLVLKYAFDNLQDLSTLASILDEEPNETPHLESSSGFDASEELVRFNWAECNSNSVNNLLEYFSNENCNLDSYNDEEDLEKAFAGAQLLQSSLSPSSPVSCNHNSNESFPAQTPHPSPINLVSSNTVGLDLNSISKIDRSTTPPEFTLPLVLGISSGKRPDPRSFIKNIQKNSAEASSITSSLPSSPLNLGKRSSTHQTSTKLIVNEISKKRPLTFAHWSRLDCGKGTIFGAFKKLGPVRKSATDYTLTLKERKYPNEIALGTKNLIDSESTCDIVHVLPATASPSDAILRLTPQTMNEVLEEKYAHRYSHLVIIDCRYPYEYKGGHIPDAINISSLDEIGSLLFKASPKDGKINKLDSDSVIIFHCEFSSERAPRMALHVRNLDRDTNAENYPRLNYPQLYILEGGYKAFYQTFPERCDPPHEYVPMRIAKHRDELRHHQRLKFFDDCMASKRTRRMTIDTYYQRSRSLIFGSSNNRTVATIRDKLDLSSNAQIGRNSSNLITKSSVNTLLHSILLSSEGGEDIYDRADEVIAATHAVFL